MRKIYFNLSLMLWFSLAISACKKEVMKMGSGTSALTIVNGVTGNNYLLTNYNGNTLLVPFYNQLNHVPYGSTMFSSSYSGRLNLSLYQTADTILNGKPLFNLALDLPVNTTHTLFLMGTTQVPDTVFTTDQLPYHLPADSTMGIRFINMSRGGARISVNLTGQPNGSEATNLPYKGITTFKTYAANSKISSYTFEFRDQVTNALLGSYLLDGINFSGSDIHGANIWRNNNITLALLSEPTGFPFSRVKVVRY